MKKDELTVAYLQLMQSPGIGPYYSNRLLSMCGSIEKYLQATEEELQVLDERLAGRMIGADRIKDLIAYRDGTGADAAEKIYERCLERDISVVTMSDPDYPERFRGHTDMPPVLFIKGVLHINDGRISVGIVGARRCSREGKEKAIHLAEETVRQSGIVISGMAKGIDAYAHTAALRSEGYTVAVLGNGADICYPAEHKSLYEALTARGCVISEYPPGTQPKRYMFPKRNRLIAALSDSLYVIDAGRHSGTESTVAWCGKYGKDVITWKAL